MRAVHPGDSLPAEGKHILTITKQLYLAAPRGFCAGVRRALDTVDAALAAADGRTVHVLNEIVHNDFIVEGLRQRGVVFVRRVEDAPPGSILIFSAHGVSPEVEQAAREHGLLTVDATCPLVKRIHRKAAELRRSGQTVFLIGHRRHPETEGTLGHLDGEAIVIENVADAAAVSLPPETPCAYLTQTTLSAEDTAAIVAELKKRLPLLSGGGDLCYATTNRQNAIRLLAGRCDTILVIGSPKSSNSNRLREVAASGGVRACLINSAAEVTDTMLRDAVAIGISAGASAPECLVEELCLLLRQRGWPEPHVLSCAEEKVNFSPPVIPITVN